MRNLVAEPMPPTPWEGVMAGAIIMRSNNNDLIMVHCCLLIVAYRNYRKGTEVQLEIHRIKNLGSSTRPVPVSVRVGHLMHVQLEFFPVFVLGL